MKCSSYHYSIINRYTYRTITVTEFNAYDLLISFYYSQRCNYFSYWYRSFLDFNDHTITKWITIEEVNQPGDNFCILSQQQQNEKTQNCKIGYKQKLHKGRPYFKLCLPLGRSKKDIFFEWPLMYIKNSYGPKIDPCNTSCFNQFPMGFDH